MSQTFVIKQIIHFNKFAMWGDGWEDEWGNYPFELNEKIY